MLDYFFPDMKRRNTTDKERLELAEVEPDLVRRTLRQFSLINRLLSGSGALMREHFFPIMARNPERCYTLLDLGAGGCDIALWAAREARLRGLKLHITALDNDRRTLPFAHQAVRDYPEISIMEGDALDLSRLGSYDFVFSNHLLHHLAWNDIRTVLEQVIAKSRLAFVMNDVKRSNWAYLGFTVFSALGTRRSYHYHDGRLSIRRGFLAEELRELVRDHFPDREIQVTERCPARVVLARVGKEAFSPP